MYRIYTAIAIPVIFIVTALIAFGTYVLLKDRSKKARNIPFVVISVIFLCIETAKQIYEFTRPDGYNIYSIPLHVCSFFVFFPIFAAALKPELKITKVFWSLSINTAVIVTIAMLAAPEIIMGNQTEAVMTGTAGFIEYHSVTHHILIVLYTFLVIFFKPWKPDIKESIYAAAIFGGFLLASWVMANVLDTDFASFIRFGTGFFIQLAVWLVHLVCFTFSSVLIMYVRKGYLKFIEKRNGSSEG